MAAAMPVKQKLLEIGNYPPPLCGWAIQTKFLVEELRRRGHACEVLNINENRRTKGADFVDVQNGLDYLWKLLRFALRGYRFHVHVNAMSPKGYLLALAAVLIGRLAARPAGLTFHGGLPQAYFPRRDSRRLWWAFKILFHLAGQVSCDSEEIKQAIVAYGVPARLVAAIACFSVECLTFRPVPLAADVEAFLASHEPIFFCYLSYRPEYRLEVLREAMARFRARLPRAGFVWLGFPSKELPAAQADAGAWPPEEAAGLLLLGNLPHDEFLTLLSRSFAFIRTPACDGISASVLESLALGIPVVASENGRRPSCVLTYREEDAADLCEKLAYLTEHYADIKAQTRLETAESNVQRMADWLLEPSPLRGDWEPAHAR